MSQLSNNYMYSVHSLGIIW